MKRTLVAYAILLICLTAACSEKAVSTKPLGESTRQKAESGQVQEVQDRELQTQIEQIASAAKGHVGMSAIVLETGEMWSRRSARSIETSIN